MTPGTIRALRKRLGLSQQGIADRLNAIDPVMRVDRNAVSRWERGARTPNPHSLAALTTLMLDEDDGVSARQRPASHDCSPCL